MQRLRAIFDWLGRKLAAFVFAALLFALVTYLRPEATDAFGLWITGLYGVFVTGNAAISVKAIGKEPPKPEAT